MTSLVMNGFDKVYPAPRKMRDEVGNRDLSAWDLLPLAASGGECAQWADGTLTAVLATLTKRPRSTLGCPDADCEDTGFYAIEDKQDDTIWRSLIRREGEGRYEILQAAGFWEPWRGQDEMVLLTMEDAVDLADALLAGAGGLARRWFWPVAWLPPATLTYSVTAAVDTATQGWTPFAVVDDLDPGAVIALIRLAPGPKLERYEGGSWVEDAKLLSEVDGINPPPLVELSEEQLQDVMEQITPTTTAAVSPDPRAEKLRRYWAEGKGALKIKWGVPGDFKRCVRQLNKYMPGRAEGYCANLHKRTTGKWPGRGRNRGHAASLEASLLNSLQAGMWLDLQGRAVDMLKDGIYTEALDDAGLVRAVLAGGFPVAPPAEWFEDPKLTGPTPLTVDDDGRVYGHIATWDQSHIGLPGRVTAPKSRSKYSYFKTGTLRTAAGTDVNVGQLTLAGGHAPLNADAAHAVAHYDNTASAAADVNIGEDRYGIWAAGGLRPDIKPEQVRALRASAPSGDWRPINGALELVAVCQVNVPGFPVARARVASGAITALVAAGARPLAVMRASMRADAAVVERLSALENAIYKPEIEEDDDEEKALHGYEEPNPAEEPAEEGEQEEATPEPVTPAEPGPEEEPVSEELPEQPEVPEPLPDDPTLPAPENPDIEPITEMSAVDKARAAVRERKLQALRDRVHPKA